ncbi:MAG TPA: hypothetical protein VGD94_13025 [Vicinamibacterales bacterium]
MTGPHPPRLAVALLHRFLDENEPLAGDLLEGFAIRQSRLWFWRQVLCAIVLESFRRRDLGHPLGLADDPSPVERPRNFKPRRINLTASPLPDVGGLGLVVFGVLVAIVRPEILWLLVPAVLGGVALGVTMAIVRRPSSGPSARHFLTNH